MGNRPGLERIRALLEEMGNPQQGLKYVHIAGTNGKGSTSLIIADVLIKAGYKVGRFTSPHLHSYFERFTVDGHEITEEKFKSILNSIEKHVQVMIERGGVQPTEFEVLSAVAFQYFRNEGVDVAVLEVGMGGSYDSTNVIVPVVSVVTGVDFDHTAYLGNTLREIALNKAGIIKPGVPVVVGVMEAEALEAIRRQASCVNTEIYPSSQTRISQVGTSTMTGQIVDIAGKGLRMKEVEFSLLGNYQLNNLATALTALQIMRNSGYRVEEQNIRLSLAGLRIPGRLEILQHSPLVIADVAHNPQAARALADSLENLLAGRKRVVIIGLVDDKDRDGILKPIGCNTRAIVVTRPQGPRGNDWQEVGERWQQIFPEIKLLQIENISEAVDCGLDMIQKDEYMIITGSFYVLDQARQYFNK